MLMHFGNVVRCTDEMITQRQAAARLRVLLISDKALRYLNLVHLPSSPPPLSPETGTEPRPESRSMAHCGAPPVDVNPSIRFSLWAVDSQRRQRLVLFGTMQASGSRNLAFAVSAVLVLWLVGRCQRYPFIAAGGG